MSDLPQEPITIPDQQPDLGPESPLPPDAPVGLSQQGLMLVVAVGVLFIFGAFIGGMYFSSLKQRAVSEDVTQPESAPTNDALSENERPYFNTYADGAVENPLTVEWLELEAQEKGELHKALHDVVYASYLTADVKLPYGVNEMSSPASFKLGTIKGGRYDAFTLYLEIAVLPGLGEYYQIFYVLQNPNDESDLVMLDHYAGTMPELFAGPRKPTTVKDELTGGSNTSLEWQAFLDSKMQIDRIATIPELEYDDIAADTKGNTFRLSGAWNRIDYPRDYRSGDKGPPEATLENGQSMKIHTSDEFSSVGLNQFYFIGKDGRLVWYDAVIPFFMQQSDATGAVFPVTVSGIPQITWDDGTQNEAVYMKGALGGCGFTTITNVLSDETVKNDLPELKKTGTARTNDELGTMTNIWEPVTLEHPYYDAALNVWAFTEGRTSSEFAERHPYVYFQDAFGRWIELVSQEVVPPVECGKPVIYLYPEVTTDVNVSLEPAGGFSKSEPAYRDGWRVTAYPNGRLVNRDDGRVYPYLFWEGRGGAYAKPRDYWVVAREDVQSFLAVTLRALGLNGRETFDFMEFWLPRMQDAPYYKIGFHGTEAMNALAPMELSVRPDSILRILMDYEELDAPVTARPPRALPHFDRRGFSVVEWGGVLQ